MRVSKETTTRVAEGARVIGEVIESGDAAIVRLHRGSGAPLQIDASEWQAFADAVKAMDRYVPNGTRPAIARVARKRRRVIAKPAAVAPISISAVRKGNGRYRGRSGFVTVTLKNGARLVVGPLGQQGLQRIAAEPDRWWLPRELTMGQQGATALHGLFRAGLVDKQDLRPSGKGGSWGKYRVNARGVEAVAQLRGS